MRRSWGPRSGSGTLRRLAGKEVFELASRDQLDRLWRQSGEEPTAQSDCEDRFEVHVGGVAAEKEPPRRHQREQRDQITRIPPGGVEEEVGMGRNLLPEPAEVGDPGMSEDDRTVAMRLGQSENRRAERADAEPGVNQNRHSRLGGDGEDLLDSGMVEPEALRAGMKLDPLGARGECVRGCRGHAFDPGVEACEGRQSLRCASALLHHPLVLGFVAGGHAKRKDHRAAAYRFEVSQGAPGRSASRQLIGAGVGVDVERSDAIAKRDQLGPDHLPKYQRARLES